MTKGTIAYLVIVGAVILVTVAGLIALEEWRALSLWAGVVLIVVAARFWPLDPLD